MSLSAPNVPLPLFYVLGLDAFGAQGIQPFAFVCSRGSSGSSHRADWQACVQLFIFQREECQPCRSTLWFQKANFNKEVGERRGRGVLTWFVS